MDFAECSVKIFARGELIAVDTSFGSGSDPAHTAGAETAILQIFNPRLALWCSEARSAENDEASSRWHEHYRQHYPRPAVAKVQGVADAETLLD